MKYLEMSLIKDVQDLDNEKWKTIMTGIKLYLNREDKCLWVRRFNIVKNSSLPQVTTDPMQALSKSHKGFMLKLTS